jgi:uncharacterized protein (DUF1697 family)
MPRYVAFLRAINVGTANRIKMVDLVGLLEEVGCQDVSWYLQSGNMFFDTRRSPVTMAAEIEARVVTHGMKNVSVMLRSAEQLEALIAREPFVNDDNETHHFSVSFLRQKPTVTPTDRLAKHGAIVRYLDDSVVCVSIPRSAELSGGVSTVIDKQWGTASTTRWWNVVEEVASRMRT